MAGRARNKDNASLCNYYYHTIYNQCCTYIVVMELRQQQSVVRNQLVMIRLTLARTIIWYTNYMGMAEETEVMHITVNDASILYFAD